MAFVIGLHKRAVACAPAFDEGTGIDKALQPTIPWVTSLVIARRDKDIFPVRQSNVTSQRRLIICP